MKTIINTLILSATTLIASCNPANKSYTPYEHGKSHSPNDAQIFNTMEGKDNILGIGARFTYINKIDGRRIGQNSFINEFTSLLKTTSEFYKTSEPIYLEPGDHSLYIYHRGKKSLKTGVIIDIAAKANEKYYVKGKHIYSQNSNYPEYGEIWIEDQNGKIVAKEQGIPFHPGQYHVH